MKVSKRVQEILDRNVNGLSDEQRIRNLELFEADNKALLNHPNGAFRKNAKEQLSVLAALRARVSA